MFLRVHNGLIYEEGPRLIRMRVNPKGLVLIRIYQPPVPTNAARLVERLY